MRTSSGSVAANCALAMAGGQVEIFLPVPWQCGQATLNFMRPPVCVIWPVPLHSEHFPGASMLTLSVASAANVLARNIEPHHAAANRRPERNVYLVFQVGACFGAGLGAAPPRPPPRC